jgi:hypothetical protein
VLEPSELPVELSAGPVDDVSPLDELPLVDSDTLVTAGPDENPGGATSPQAARASAARIDRTNFPYHQRQEPASPGSLALTTHSSAPS